MTKVTDEEKEAAEKRKWEGAHKRRAKRNTQYGDGMRTKLYAPERPGFYRRWINEEGTKVQQALDKGFLPVENNDGDNKYIYSEQKTGRKIQRVGVDGEGKALRAVLMEQPIAFREEDVQAKINEINEVEDQLVSGKLDGGLTDADNITGTRSLGRG